MDDFTNKRSFDLKATCIMDELGLFFDLLSMGVRVTKHWQKGIWSFIMPGLPTHLVQEIHADIVCFRYSLKLRKQHTNESKVYVMTDLRIT